MGLIGHATPIGYRQKRVSLANPGTPVPDGDGGYTETPLVPLAPPQVFAHVRPAAAKDLERFTGATTLAQATHIVTLPFHPGITTETVLTVEDTPAPDRRFSVVAKANLDERDATLELACTEIIE